MSSRKDSSFRKAFYHLKMAQEYFNDTIRENEQTIAAKFSRKYASRLEWVIKDFSTTNLLPKDALETFKNDLNGDVLFHEAISRKSLELSDTQKETLEVLLDSLIAGEEVTVKIQ